MEYRSLPPERPGALRSDDHRLQSGATCTPPITSAACSRPFPGVFTGIGEFTLHKEFVSAKIAGGTGEPDRSRARRLLDFGGRGRVGRCSSTTTWTCRFPSRHSEPAYLDAAEGAGRAPSQDDDHLGAHRASAASCGRSKDHAAVLEAMLADPRSRNLYFDLSWNEIAKYVVASPEATRVAAAS